MTGLKTLIEAHKFETTLKEEVDSKICVTELVRCKTAYGKPFFAYIRIKPSQYMEYKHKIDQGDKVNPNDYDILEYGWGENPPEAVQRIMEERHGVDHDFENQIRKVLEQTRHEKTAEA